MRSAVVFDVLHTSYAFPATLATLKRTQASIHFLKPQPRQRQPPSRFQLCIGGLNKAASSQTGTQPPNKSQFCHPGTIHIHHLRLNKAQCSAASAPRRAAGAWWSRRGPTTRTGCRAGTLPERLACCSCAQRLGRIFLPTKGRNP